MKLKRCYLFSLEVAPLEVGRTYSELPRHITLMHRFYSDLPPTDLANLTGKLFNEVQQFILIPDKVAVFGPPDDRVKARTMVHSDELMALHRRLFQLLKKLGVEFTMPEWVGDGYKPHSTERDDFKLVKGQKLPCTTVYLTEVIEPNTLNQRIVRERFLLKPRLKL